MAKNPLPKVHVFVLQRGHGEAYFFIIHNLLYFDDKIASLQTGNIPGNNFYSMVQIKSASFLRDMCSLDKVQEIANFSNVTGHIIFWYIHSLCG